MGDCGVDVLLGKLGEVFEGVLLGDQNDNNDRAGDRGEGGVVRVSWRRGDDVSLQKEKVEMEKTAEIERGCLLEGFYGLAKQGRFEYTASDVVYGGNETDVNDTNNGYTERDATVLSKLKKSLRNELDCQVCYSLILDPLTTPCGHTFCRECVARILDHSDLCPICRRKMNLPPTVQSEPVNGRIARLIDLLYPDQIAARREAVARDEFGLDDDDEKTLPLFVCALTFPTMPTFLHIFEPRYRLMIRRVMENGGGKFGMLMSNRSGLRQGELGRPQFTQYGTLLVVDRFELLPDGRSLVLATGLSRFKVVEWGMLDGYHVGKVERVDDVSLADEENLESMETASAAVAAVNATPVPEGSSNNDSGNDEVPLESMSTQQLLQLGLDFVQRQRAEGAPWLQPRVLMAYGDTPTDPVRFPWWLASVLRISEDEKYPLLLATSVRERLKITAGWARKLEAKEWYVFLCSIFFFFNAITYFLSSKDHFNRQTAFLVTSRPSLFFRHPPSSNQPIRVSFLVSPVYECRHFFHAIHLFNLHLHRLRVCCCRCGPVRWKWGATAASE